jgi:DNA primase
MNAVAALLDRLDRVKQTAPNRWIAQCPAHEDRSPSLSIRELDDGRVLLYDFGGCETGDVLAALGLTLADLFDEPMQHHVARSKSSIPARDLLEIISEEATVVALIGADILEHHTVVEEDWSRLATAVNRIGRARDHVRGR